MKASLIAALPLVVALSSCASKPHYSTNVERFFADAKTRASTGNVTSPINLNGLRFTLGTLPNAKKEPRNSREDSVLVSDVDSGIRDAVQIVVNPAVGDNLPDAQQPSPEFLEQLERDTMKALRRSRYVSVERGRLPDPGAPDVTPLPAREEESIQIIEHRPTQGARVLYSTYGSDPDRSFVLDLVGKLRPRLEANDIKDSFGPDGGFIEIIVKSGQESWTLRSWHPLYEENPNSVATINGLETLDGRSREEVLAAQPEDYRNFRAIFDEILAAMKRRK